MGQGEAKEVKGAKFWYRCATDSRSVRDMVIKVYQEVKDLLAKYITRGVFQLPETPFTFILALMHFFPVSTREFVRNVVEGKIEGGEVLRNEVNKMKEEWISKWKKRLRVENLTSLYIKDRIHISDQNWILLREKLGVDETFIINGQYTIKKTRRNLNALVTQFLGIKRSGNSELVTAEPEKVLYLSWLLNQCLWEQKKKDGRDVKNRDFWLSEWPTSQNTRSLNEELGSMNYDDLNELERAVYEFDEMKEPSGKDEESEDDEENDLPEELLFRSHPRRSFSSQENPRSSQSQENSRSSQENPRLSQENPRLSQENSRSSQENPRPSQSSQENSRSNQVNRENSRNNQENSQQSQENPQPSQENFHWYNPKSS